MVNNQEGILSAGELLNNTYEIEELVGQGGTGEVYLARNIISGRKFAIKILKQEFANNETFINLMRRESDVLHEVRDDAVVRYNELLRSELHGGFVFLVMEYIAGPQLMDIIKERGSIDEKSLFMVAKRMAQGLKAAHDKKAFHRDMSPDNIILPDGDMSKAKLIDFGIARDLNDNAQTVVGGGFAGKYQYASPEQMDGNVDARSDLYSLGMTLLRAYRGEPIEIGSSLMEIVKNKALRPDTRDVPGKLGIMITRLVEPNPADRFQSADELLAFLNGKAPVSSAAIEEATVIAPQTRSRRAEATTTMPPEPGSKSGGGGKWVLVLMLLAALGGGGWYFGIGPGKAMLFGPKFPLAAPYILQIASAGGQAPVLVSGNVPGPEAATQSDAALALLFPESALQSDYEFASGMPTENWLSDVPQIVAIAADLSNWKVVFEDRSIAISGEADDENDAIEAGEDAQRVANALGYSLSQNIVSAYQPIDLAALNTELQKYQTCGPLRISGANGVTADITDRLTVSGIIARQSDAEVIDLVLQDLAEGQPIDYNLAVLNAPVCMIESMLPARSSLGFEISYSYGTKAGYAADGVYREGENPVIDVVLPASRVGFLYGFYIDAEGQVFHLLPHNARPNNVLPSIGEEENGVRTVRLAFPADEATTEKLGFNVVAPFGTSLIVVMVTNTPLFDGLRPRAESVEAFRDALSGALATVADGRTLFASRYLVTEP